MLDPVHGGPPTVLVEQRARQIVQTLGLSIDDQEMLRRVEGFIRCNGFPEVLAAAEKTRRISQRRPIHDPWDYARAVFNHGLGYSSHLYSLLHLAETSLRAWVDTHIASVRGADWHLHMDQLLHPRNRLLLSRDLEQIQLVGEARGARLEDFDYAYQLLVHLNLSTLRALIEQNYGARPFGLQLYELSPMPEQLPSVRQPVAPSALLLMLAQINNIRHDVMHHHPVTLDDFRRVAPILARLLEFLAFNFWPSMSTRRSIAPNGRAI